MSQPNTQPEVAPNSDASAAALASASGTAALERLHAVLDGDLERGLADLVGANLAGCDLSGLDLSGLDFSRADLSGAQFVRSDLSGSSLRGAMLTEAELLGANLTDADLSDARAERAGFGAAKLRGACLLNAHLGDSTFTDGQLQAADLRAADLRGARLDGASLEEANLGRANLSAASLTGCNVADACFEGARLTDARVSRLDHYTRANWIGTDTRGADFTGAHLVARHIRDENYIHEFKHQSRVSRVVHAIWWLTSDCGRSITRWALVTGVVAIAFAVLYTTVAIDFGDYATPLSPLYFSVVTLTTLGYGDVLPASPAAQIVAMCQVFIGYVMLGGMLSIFSNKMARRAD